MRTIVLNGAPFEVTRTEGSLLDVLRRDAGLKAAALGCRDRRCGACRVLVDGIVVDSCHVQAGALRDGAVVETYEALAVEPAVARAVGAFDRERSTRCKLCTPGLGVTACALARAGGRADTDALIGDAACMCTGRGSWRRALALV